MRDSIKIDLRLFPHYVESWHRAYTNLHKQFSTKVVTKQIIMLTTEQTFKVFTPKSKR